MISYLAVLLLAPQLGGDAETLFRIDYPVRSSFGSSVAGSGDVNGDGIDDFVVGAPFQSGFWGSEVGSTVVYSGATGLLLFAFNGQWSEEQHGTDVAGTGDVDGDGLADIITGGPNAGWNGLSRSGSAYVYSAATGALLHRFDGASVGDGLGISVAGAGDVNADGVADLIVGSWAGQAYVYSGASGAVLFQFAGGTFHTDVAAAGDVNGDGYADLLVGADNSSAGTSSAVVYSGATGAVLHRYSDVSPGDSMGRAVANAGDVDGDGIDDQLVGAVGASPGGLMRAGSVFVYSGASGTLLHRFDGNLLHGELGRAVAGVGDIDGDGRGDLLIGSGALEQGLAYLISGASGKLLHRFRGAGASDRFGDALSAGGDFNADGIADFIIGARATQSGSVQYAGSVYVGSFHVILQSSATTVSAATGGIVGLELNFRQGAAGDGYKVLISGTGSGPGYYGVPIPLTMDSLVMDTFFGNYPASTTNMHGTLDAAGNASASMTVPAGLPSALIGRTYWMAAIASQPGQLPEYSSVAVPISITQ